MDFQRSTTHQPPRRQRWGRARWLPVLSLLGFLVSVLPIPIPAMRVVHDVGMSEDHEGPYPCQQGRCGCGSALQCWTSCCCHTPSERKAWAEQHRITPPQYAVLNDADAWNPPPPAKPASCCNQGSKRTKSCCDDSKSKSSLSKASIPPRTLAAGKRAKNTFVLTMLMKGCRKGSSVFTTLPWSTQPPASVAPSIESPVSECLVVSMPLWQNCSQEPPSPPPKA